MKYIQKMCDMGLDALLKDFAERMKNKVRQKTLHGWHGWSTNEPDWRRGLVAKLKRDVENEDWVDVANYAAMLWNFDAAELEPEKEEELE